MTRQSPTAERFPIGDRAPAAKRVRGVGHPSADRGRGKQRCADSESSKRLEAAIRALVDNASLDGFTLGKPAYELLRASACPPLANSSGAPSGNAGQESAQVAAYARRAVNEAASQSVDLSQSMPQLCAAMGLFAALEQRAANAQNAAAQRYSCWKQRAVRKNPRAYGRGLPLSGAKEPPPPIHSRGGCRASSCS